MMVCKARSIWYLIKYSKQNLPVISSQTGITVKMCIPGGNLRNSIIGANPLISVIISFHQIVQHGSTLINQFGKISGCFCILVIFFHMHHQEDDSFAHWSALHACTSMVIERCLILFDCLRNSEFEDLWGSGVTQTEHSLDCLACVFELLGCVIVLVKLQSLLIILSEMILDLGLDQVSSFL